MSDKQTGDMNNNWKGGPQEGICRRCGSTFTAPRWELKRRKYCSRDCYEASKLIPVSRPCRKHTRVVERILGHRLPRQAVVHHLNENRDDNRPGNLIICENQAYHLLIHARARILRAGGKPSTDKICSKCGAVKSKTDFHLASNKGDGYRCYCKSCQSLIYQERRAQCQN